MKPLSFKAHACAMILLLTGSNYAFAAASDWMSEIFEQTPSVALNQIILPGTHDSATSDMTSSSPLSSQLTPWAKLAPRSSLAAWSKTQQRSIYEQLEDGIRYIDLRLEQTESGVYSVHGLLSTPLEVIVADISRFAVQHPREIVIIDLQSLQNFNDLDPLLAALDSFPEIGNRIATWPDFSPSSTLAEFWQADVNVILLSNLRRSSDPDSSQAQSLFWPRVVDNPWPNTRHTAKVEEQLIQDIQSQRPKSNRFYVSQAVLTPDANVVTTGWLRGINSLRDMAVKWMNPKLSELMERLFTAANQHQSHVNIIIADFYQESALIDKALILNERRLHRLTSD